VSVLFKTQGLSPALNYEATTEDYLDVDSLQHEMILKNSTSKLQANNRNA
jgi:hypothetical protein